MSNSKPSSVPSDPAETVEEPSAVDEDSGKKNDEEKPHQDTTDKGNADSNGVLDNGPIRRKEKKAVSGEKRKREKRKFLPREEISRIR